MDLIDDTLASAADLGRAAADHSTGAAAIVGSGLVRAAQQGQAVVDDAADVVAGDRNWSRRLVLLVVLAALGAGLALWRRRADQDDPTQ